MTDMLNRKGFPMNERPISGRSSRQLRLKAMKKRQVESFDPHRRAAAKQVARDADARALAGGERTEAQLHRENGLLALPREGLSVDFAGFIAPSR
jgi:hypothetical protein